MPDMPIPAINESNPPLSRWISDWGKVVFGFFVIASAPLLYVHGTIYYHSYLEVFGLEPALFAIDKESTFVKGYFVALQMGTSVLIYLLGFVVVLFCAAFLVDDLIQRGKWNDKPMFNSATAKGFAVSCVASITAVAGIILLALSLVTSYKFGASEAIKDAEQFKMKAPAVNISRVVVTIESGLLLEGYKILCSDKWCAFYINSKVEVYPIERIRSLRSGII